VPAGSAAPKIICPSVSAFYTYPAQMWNAPSIPDIPSFLNFLDANNIRCDAFSWHENESNSPFTDTNNQPQIITSHVNQFRALLAQHPNLGDPSVIINEFGRPTDMNYYAPGWIAGELGALEDAQVAGAQATCTWWVNGVDCLGGTLDGLLINDTGGTRAGYWVHQFYGGMTGNVVPTTTTAEQVSTFATRDDAAGVVKILVGRHDVGGVEGLNLAVRLPWSANTVRVGVQPIPDNSGAWMAAPVVQYFTLTPVNGVLSIPGWIGPTDAFTVTLTRAS
jgi:hypothetical protein